MSEALDKVRTAALELPETGEKLSHGKPTFFVADRIAASWELAAPSRLLEAGGR